MTDEPDFLDRVESISRNWAGEKWSADRALQEFQHYGFEYRTNVLDNLDQELARADTADLRRYSELTSVCRRLRDVHHTMRRAGR